MFNIYIIHSIFRYFLNAYKNYKSYYPVRYPKNERILVLNNNVICDLTGIKTSELLKTLYYSTGNVCNDKFLLI